MYRIAMMEKDPDTREKMHRLAALFFAGRRESAAFVICEDSGAFPKNYDCYLLGDATCISLLREPAEAPWKTSPKPLDQELFFEMLAAWRASVSAARPHLLKRKDVS